MNDLPPEMIALGALIDAEPRNPDLKRVYDVVAKGICLQHRYVKEIKEAAEELLVETKHLMFDLEATRRERDELRERFGESNGS